MLRPRYIVSFFIIFALSAGIFLARPTEHQVRQQRLQLGTVVEIVASGTDRSLLEDALLDAFNEIDRIERLMSPRIATSDVARLSLATDPLEVSPATAEVIQLGLEIAQASGGAFDMSLGRLKELWGIESEAPRVPSPEEIKTALVGTGPQSLTLNGRTVSKQQPTLKVDLGAIAKGYALDRAAALLRQHGIAHASLNAGGDIVLIGNKAADTPWRIGIQDPLSPDQTIATLELRDQAVVTSGDYERFVEIDGKRYHHLFDPQTGSPGHRSRSVTIIANGPNGAALADALATAVFVLGPEKGIKLLDQFPDAEGLIIDPAGKPHQTAGMTKVLSWH